MKIRLWTCVLVAALALGGVLFSFCQVPAGEIMVPADAVVESQPPRCGQQVSSTTSTVPTMLVNSRRIRLNYSITDVGPSGISHVELWATRDTKNWQRYSKEPPPVGPMVVHVAEEGRYGFNLVVRNGVGLCSQAPHRGEEPQLWVVVDETAPAVKLTGIEVGKGQDLGTMTIGWKSSDAHIKNRPVSISYGTTKTGPWKKVVGKLEDTGSYVWRMPGDLPYQFHIKVEAEDQAGNVGSVVSVDPVRIDNTRPKGVILGVEGQKYVLPKPTFRRVSLPESQPQVTPVAPVTGELRFGVDINPSN